MRPIKTYLSLEYQGIDSATRKEVFKIHAFLYIPEGSGVEVVSNEIIRDNPKIQTYDELSGYRKQCSKFIIQLKNGNGPTGVIHFESQPFLRDRGIDHVWVKPKGHSTANPDEGAVGNYNDPDG
ncbi:hypothetical protein [Roseivirga misakiensis]|uniref:Uncharacterized protein n=1 Tax=Roseivirga misakiensis TaxID=1563681 RepID=A0A1E5SZD5_9BACT|nr:hypothetical protein [Roseivirga misakiensis]OEK04407.1 hypothetical protein BFP71_13080 [Roseivirga misakiensis]